MIYHSVLLNKPSKTSPWFYIYFLCERQIKTIEFQFNEQFGFSIDDLFLNFWWKAVTNKYDLQCSRCKTKVLTAKQIELINSMFVMKFEAIHVFKQIKQMRVNKINSKQEFNEITA